jgi:thiamine biosynthesis lipoprotein ApbE
MNLTELRQRVRGLSHENRILLLSLIADECDDCDELTAGLQALAIQEAEKQSANEFAIADIADGIIPQAGSTRQDWEAHRAMRDATLAHALSWNVRRAAA